MGSDNAMTLFPAVASGTAPAPLDVNYILQPRFLTKASYKFNNKLHKDIFVHIREELQQYLVKDAREVMNRIDLQVPLFTSDYPHFFKRPEKFYEYVLEMSRREFFVSFSWQYSDNMPAFLRWFFDLEHTKLKYKPGDMIHKTVSLISGATYSEGDNRCILVSINRAAVPFLLYYGQGVSCVEIDRDVELGFTAKTSRIYEWLMDWSRDGSVYKMPLSEFRERLCLSRAYDKICNIKSRILDPAMEEINDSDSTVKFSYEFVYDSSYPADYASPTKKAFNVIVFRMERLRLDRRVEAGKKALYLCLQEIADRECQPMCREALDAAVEKGVNKKLLSKFVYYTKRRNEGYMRKEEYVNTMLLIVREMVGVDLRSVQHVRNARLKKVRGSARKMKEPVLISDTLF